MTLEIRQMVIRSDIAHDAGKTPTGPAAGDDDGGGCDDSRSGAEALRSSLATELERLRER